MADKIEITGFMILGNSERRLAQGIVNGKSYEVKCAANATREECIAAIQAAATTATPVSGKAKE